MAPLQTTNPLAGVRFRPGAAVGPRACMVHDIVMVRSGASAETARSWNFPAGGGCESSHERAHNRWMTGHWDAEVAQSCQWQVVRRLNFAERHMAIGNAPLHRRAVPTGADTVNCCCRMEFPIAAVQVVHRTILKKVIRHFPGVLYILPVLATHTIVGVDEAIVHGRRVACLFPGGIESLNWCLGRARW